ncbi:phage tail protein [Sphingosinicellaceae bacterium]|nr:phage tail protein [Sphingosinicellaceae bacterium]
MATLILGTVGRVIGGPLGGLVGTFLGSVLDRSLLGGGKARQVGRLSNLAVQSSAYGEPIPRLYGTMRIAGNLVWTAGIAEHSSTSGGGKRGGAKTTSYTYSSSFAVILSARPVAGIGRVWADGKLLRDAAGTWITPATMRLHLGGDGQSVDPLIAAAEAAGGAPAYRGLAYAVFEDLPLADYGNRIPNLTFELIADADGTGAGAVVADLCAAAKIEGVAPVGIFQSFGGFAAAQGGSVREQLGQLTELYDLRFVDDGTGLGVCAGPAVASITLAADDLGSHDASSSPHEARSEARGAGGQLDDAVALGFFDPARDYQPGLQRAVRRADAARIAQVDIAAAFSADSAKGLAGALLARRNAARVGATFQLPPRSLDVRAGTAVRREGDTTTWSVRRWTFANFVSEVAVERKPVRLASAAVADPGRVHDAGDSAAGATTLHLLDLPPLFGEAAGPRLYVAGAGASPGWRRSSVALSLDGGETYTAIGEVGAPSVVGTTVSTLSAGSGDRWDRTGRVEVELLADSLWLESRAEAVVLAGANLALINNEIVQFASVEALGGRRFALSMLLRGRRATDVAAHPAGGRFVMLDPERLLALDLGSEVIGRSLRVRATGAGDGATQPVAIDFAGNAARPLPPVFVRCVADGGDAVFAWKRRSRSGFAWLDGVDAPVGESAESYRVEVRRGATLVRAVTVAVAGWRYLAADRAADLAGAGATVTLAIAQLGDLAGVPAHVVFILP